MVTLENVSPCIMLRRHLPQWQVSSAGNLAQNLVRPNFSLPPQHLFSRHGIETGTSQSGLPPRNTQKHQKLDNEGKFFFTELYLNKILKNKHALIWEKRFCPLLFNILPICLLINGVKNLLPFFKGGENFLV